MPENKPVKPGSVWETEKLHLDTTRKSSEIGVYQSDGKRRPSIVLRTFGSVGNVEKFQAIYLTHSGHRKNVIGFGNLLDDSDSFGECPPQELPENMFISYRETLDKQLFDTIKAMIRNWWLKDLDHYKS